MSDASTCPVAIEQQFEFRQKVKYVKSILWKLWGPELYPMNIFVRS